MTNLLGRRLGRYDIQSELGRGGMARVYRATDTLLQRQVAVKVLAAQLSLDPEFVQRFDREAKTAAGLRHPAIVTVYNVEEADGLHFIVMELIQGRSLHTIIEEHGALGLNYAISILEPISQALDYAHSQGAVHRDIKPHNILISDEGQVLLTDFGIAITLDTDGQRLTRTGIFMGTPEYISPEQAEAGRVDGRSDLYSLGVVAYEIITGRVPFSGAMPQLLVAHTQTPPPAPTSIASYLPKELDTVLAKALAKNPQQRYQSGSEFVAALGAVAQRYNTPLASRAQLALLANLDEAGQLPVVHPPSDQRSPAQAPPRRDTPVPPVVEREHASAAPLVPQAPDNHNRRGSVLPWVVGVGLLAALVLGLFIVVARGAGSNTAPTSTPVPPTPPLVVPTVAQPSTDVPTTTEQPTATETATTEPTLVPTREATVVPTRRPARTPTPRPAAPATVAPARTPTPRPAAPATVAPATNTPPPTETLTPTVTEVIPSPVLGTPVDITPIQTADATGNGGGLPTEPTLSPSGRDGPVESPVPYP